MVKSKNVAVIGFGYIGSVIGAVLADRGYNIFGVDKSERIVNLINNGETPFNEPGLSEKIAQNVKNGRLKLSTDSSITEGCNIFVITVGTPLAEDFTADMSQIQAAARDIAPYVKEDSLVILKSTVPPFTTDKYIIPVFENAKNVQIAFCPERLAEGKAISEFCSIPVVVGGINEQSTKAASDFWKEALGVDVIETSSATTAEMVKLADNLWIDLNVALGGELAKLSDKIGIDVLEVIAAANSLPKGNFNVNILLPSVGVGGYCLTKDPWFVQQMGRQYGIEFMLPKGGRNVNDSMPEYSTCLIDEILSKTGKKREDMKVAIMGITFKNNTSDCRYTPVKGVIDGLSSLGYKLEICDPWVTEHDASLVTTGNVSKDIYKTLENADCVAFLAGHDDFHDIEIREMAKAVKKGALIFDGRMFYSRDKINQIRKNGMQYKGIGRQ